MAPQQSLRKSLAFKFILMIASIIVFAIAGVIAYSSINTKMLQEESAQMEAKAAADGFAAELESEIDRSLQSARVLAASFESLVDPGNSSSMSRDDAHDVLKNVLKENEQFFGVYLAWEPNAFDQRDTAFADKPGHDHTGRFIPYWSRAASGTYLLEATQGYDEQDWYLKQAESTTALVFDPQQYNVDSQQVQLVTLEAPIIQQGRFRGLVGIDISLNSLQQKVVDAASSHSDVTISVISHKGVLAATSGDGELIAKRIDTLFADGNQQLSTIQSGYSGANWGEEVYRVVVPVRFGNSEQPWQVRVEMPIEAMQAEAKAQMWMTILIGLVMLVVALFVVGVFTNQMVKPIRQMADGTADIALGNLRDRTINTNDDEIGQMKAAINAVLGGLRKTTAFANEIGQGNLDAEFSVLSEDDELGKALLDMRDKLKSNAVQDERTNWANHGLAKFGEILRNNNDDLTALGNEISSNLVKYVGANQAKFYVLEENESKKKVLKLIATYAWERMKHEEETIHVGEGLIGQCVLDREPIFLTEIPDNYIYITSGLGGAVPASVLIMPLMVNEVITGVIELASFQIFAPHQMDFVQRLGESIASSISSVKMAEQTKRLLNNTNQQAEELRAQEEEMRQNFEELQTTQEEMQRTQLELRHNETNMKALINNTTDSILLIDRDYKILIVNQVLKNRYIGTDFEHIEPGANILTMFNEKGLLDEWKAYYDRGLAGEQFEFTLESVVKGETNAYRRYYIYPMKKEGQVIGVSVISRDVTAENVAVKENDVLRQKQAELDHGEA